MTEPPESLSPQEVSVASAGLDIAAKWGDVLGPEKLELAFKALEPQLKREYQLKLRRMDDARAKEERAATAAEADAKRAAILEKASIELQAREAERRRNHVYRMSGLVAGASLSLALLGAAVAVAGKQPWLAAALTGPSLLALVKIFVLRRSDASDMRESARVARRDSTPVPQMPPDAS